jgi:hypothetical protein
MKNDAIILTTEVVMSFAYAVLAIITPDEHLPIIGWSIIGGMFGGFVSAYFTMSSNKTLRQYLFRWIVNIAASVIAGVGSTMYFEGSNPDMPIQLIAFFTAAIGGPLAVLVLPILLPKLWGPISDSVVDWVKKILSKFSYNGK